MQQTILTQQQLDALATTQEDTQISACMAQAGCSAPAVAAQEFDELKKAYAILTDKSARGALDDCLE